MRVALIGYGAVAAIHAARLKNRTELVAVAGPDGEKAERFAQQHDIPNAERELKSALSRCNAAIICSPSPAHFVQAKEALESSINVLVELPACSSIAEAETLQALAQSRDVIVQCAHTSRYAESYQRITNWIRTNALGEIRHIRYVRSIPPRKRSWLDDALLHHAEHPLDLLLYWFGPVRALGCVAHPGVPGSQEVALLASVCAGVPVSISISYTSRFSEVQMTIVGSEHTIATDGFTYVRSDDPTLTWRGDEQHVYECAIEKQDIAFLEACRNGYGGIPWSETIELTRCVEDFANIWRQ